MKVHSKKTTGAMALLAAAALVVTGCSGGTSDDGSDAPAESSSEALKIGTLLPQTGSLSYLTPGPQAAVHLAVDDINAAGGVLGQDIEVVVDANEGDATDPTVNAQGVDDILAAEPSFVLGAMGTGMTNAAMPRLTEAGVLMGSPSNTGIALTGVNDLYFRTAPPDSVQGRALANLIAQDGNAKVGILVFNNDYGTGLRDNIQATLEEQGAEVVYGAEGAGEEFPEDQTSFSAEVSAVMDQDPDAIVVLAYDQTRQIIPALDDQGFDLSNLYLVDGNTNDFSPEAEAGGFPAGLLEGAQGTIPGAQVDDEFRDKLAAIYEEKEGSKLDSFNYGPEAYDAIMLVALAAEKAGATDSASIAENLGAVSGADGGEECSTYADCLALLQDGSDIHYMGMAGIGPINEENDPSSALIGIYEYDGNNQAQYMSSIEG